MPSKLRALALMAALLLPAPAWAIWSMTDGGVTFAWTSLRSGGSSGTASADFAGAFERSSETLNAGESRTSLAQFDYNAPLPAPAAMRAPEPGTGLLMGLGLFGLAYQARRAGSMRERKQLGATERAPA